MEYNALKICDSKAEDILKRLFNIKGTASKLPGEVDFNFRIHLENHEEYVLKISRPDQDYNLLDFQQKLLFHIENNNEILIIPKPIRDIDGNYISEITDDFGNKRKVRLLTWIPGDLWNSISTYSDGLKFTLGQQCGLLTKSLQGFDHKEAHRAFVWDVAQSLWTKEYLYLFSGEEKEIIQNFQRLFEKSQPSYSTLRKGVVHNDANDNNIIVSSDSFSPSVKAVIDFGDSCYTQIINDLAIACAYAVMNHNDVLEAALPIVKGYHSAFPLLEVELEHLYNAVAMRLIISVTKSAINKIKEPNNKYLLISEKPAWEVLKKWHIIDSNFALFSFRNACGFNAHPNEKLFLTWCKKYTFNVSDLFPSVNSNNILPIDLSVSSKWINQVDDFNNLSLLESKIKEFQKEVPHKIIAGGYLEHRSIYTTDSYTKAGNSGIKRRNIHLGVDFWLPANTPVHTILKGVIVTSTYNSENKGYGGLIIIKHSFAELCFFTLYGHLSHYSTTLHKVGEIVEQNEKIGELGTNYENGNWVPHLHFQITLSLLNYINDFPGVTYLSELDVWKSICPNPNLLFIQESLSKLNNI